MARVVVLGAGVSGHTAALRLRRMLGRRGGHEVVVVSPNADWNWIPSSIWVGVGQMSCEKVVFPLAPVYERTGVEFQRSAPHQGRARPGRSLDQGAAAPPVHLQGQGTADVVADPGMSAPSPDPDPKGRTMLEQDPSIRHAPLPTRKTLRRRRNPLIQLFCFALLNGRMAYIALRGHK